ncbi:MAG: hypothetical protein SGARI_002572, partial [Bacillariaceae sp.]
MITKSEVSFLLEKAGYRKKTDEEQQESWHPPEALVTAGKLESSYGSLKSLFVDLRPLEDLESDGGSSRRRKPGVLSPTQSMALRLAIADGFAQDDASNYTSDSTAESTQSNASKKSVPRSKTAPKTAVATAAKDKKRERETQKDEEILSPDKIKVKFISDTGARNPAQWAEEELLVPLGSWHNCVTKMGCTWAGGNYYLQGKDAKTTTDRFTTHHYLLPAICEEGQDEKYLDKLENDSDKAIVRRYIRYALVPGKAHEWSKIRKLRLSETILFLNLLGFEKDADGQWTVPHGVKNIESNKYSSLSQLGEALVRVPDLEDRTNGATSRRRSKQADRILNDKQMMALRLRIAEGLEDEESLSSDDAHRPPKAARKSAPVKQPASTKKCLYEEITSNRAETDDDASHASDSSDEGDEADEKSETESHCEEVAKEALFGVCRHDTAWKYLQDLGCKWNSSFYRLPNSDKKFGTQNELT